MSKQKYVIKSSDFAVQLAIVFLSFLCPALVESVYHLLPNTEKVLVEDLK